MGAEARSKIPKDFQVQYPNFANPPTLFLVIDELCDILVGNGKYNGHQSTHLRNNETGIHLMKTLYPLMKRHYSWFRMTQAVNMTYTRHAPGLEGYRWQGRTAKHTLTSGLDDYPRANPSHPGELHVDAISWVATMAATLAKVAAFLQEDDEHASFGKGYLDVVRSIDELHWSNEHQSFCDVTVGDTHQYKFVCHDGYVSILPFALGQLALDDPRVEGILNNLRNPAQLWSSFGIRSLSKEDRFYHTAENCWRSPIWININYLILKELLVRSTFRRNFAV